MQTPFVLGVTDSGVSPQCVASAQRHTRRPRDTRSKKREPKVARTTIYPARAPPLCSLGAAHTHIARGERPQRKWGEEKNAVWPWAAMVCAEKKKAHALSEICTASQDPSSDRTAPQTKKRKRRKGSNLFLSLTAVAFYAAEKSVRINRPTLSAGILSVFSLFLCHKNLGPSLLLGRSAAYLGLAPMAQHSASVHILMAHPFDAIGCSFFCSFFICVANTARAHGADQHSACFYCNGKSRPLFLFVLTPALGRSVHSRGRSSCPLWPPAWGRKGRGAKKNSPETRRLPTCAPSARNWHRGRRSRGS